MLSPITDAQLANIHPLAHILDTYTLIYHSQLTDLPPF